MRVFYAKRSHNNVGSLDPSRLWLSDDQRLGRKEPEMIIIGVDYHPSDQYIAFVDTETGEYVEPQLNHSDRAAEKFYRELAARGVSVRVGMGGHRLLTLVREVTGRTGYRGMDASGITMIGRHS